MTTAVLLCADGAPAPNGGGRVALPAHHTVPGLCEEPERIRELAAGAERLVLGLCGARFSLGAVQREARRIGLDPLGVEIVDLDGAAGDRRRLAVLLAAAVARAGAFAGSGPEHAKLTFPARTSRRALLTFALPEYVAAPEVDHACCAAGRGCRACVDVCPTGAISLVDGRIVHDRNVCEPCGRCVTTCPTGATGNPAATPAQLEAQVRALLDPAVGAGGRRGIVYRCRRATRVETAPGWFAVTVPCTAMVTPAWLLAPLVMGAGSVAVRPCSDGGCGLGQDAVVLERVAWCRDLLAALSLSADLVGLDPDAGPPAAPLGARPVAGPFGPQGTAAVVLALADAADVAAGADGGPVAGPGPGPGDARLEARPGPLGVVDVDPEVCTLCGTCAASCPTGALRIGDTGGRRTLSFDPNACVACGTCASRCPEAARGALTMRPAVDVARLRAGRREASSSDLARCRVCGGIVAPAALLARIALLVHDDRLLAPLTTLCQDCRGMPVG